MHVRGPVFETHAFRVTAFGLFLAAVFVLSGLVLTGCFWILINPKDAPSEQAAIALATSVTTAWITAVSGFLLRRHDDNGGAEQ